MSKTSRTPGPATKSGPPKNVQYPVNVAVMGQVDPKDGCMKIGITRLERKPKEGDQIRVKLPFGNFIMISFATFTASLKKYYTYE